MTGLDHIALRIALALGALLAGAPGVAAADPLQPGAATKSGTDGVGGIEKTPGPTVQQSSGTLGQADPPAYDEGPWTDLGLGKPGALGLPKLTGYGTAAPGTVVALFLENGRPGAMATLILGLAANPVPFKNGTLVPVPQVLIAGLPVNGSGSLLLPALLPAALPSGLEICTQLWLPDPGAVAGVAASNGLLLHVP